MKLTGTELRIIRAAIEIAEAEGRGIFLPPGVKTLTALVDMIDELGADLAADEAVIAKLGAEVCRLEGLLADADESEL
jgi:hypothetical protein